MNGRFPLRGGGPRPRLIRPGGGFVRPFGFGGFGLARGLIGVAAGKPTRAQRNEIGG